ncbi:MAG: VOC family protein, partial [Bacteroidota bacterium]|nr:VOC family protein [Bacteroidota bacterium]
MAKNISGIQQVGVGIPDVKQAWKWYRKNFGLDIPIFQESAEAALMTKYTGKEVHSRSAVLALNLQGGAGLEIWQFTSRKTEPVKYDIQLGDYGIFTTAVKCRNVNEAFAFYKAEGTEIISEIKKDPAGNEHFFIKDPYGMIFQISKG